jgi:ATPase subunit of ABC transporter with duplicated ATPase domains
MSNAQIIINNLNYSLPNSKNLFKDLSLTFSAQKIGLIGKNGIGKSTLLKLIANELSPDSGNINIIGKIAYCPQNYASYTEQTIAEILAIKAKLEALNRIAQGSTDIFDFETLNDDWNVKEHTNEQLLKFGLNLELARKVNSLSGGEITRLMLAKQFILKPDFIILDEPTNNLDSKSKNLLYQVVKDWTSGLLIVSHDRQLLNLMNKIVELSSLGIKVYGGNYIDYLEQKNLEQQASLRQLEDAKKQIKQVAERIQKDHELHEQRQAAGHRLRKKGDQPKILLNVMRDRSTKNQNKMLIKEERLIADAQKKLIAAKEKIELNNEIKINLPRTYVPNGKIVLQIADLTFYYDKQKPLINNFSLTIQGAEKLAIVGENGSGKTTLIKLIMGKLKPKNGTIFLGINKVSYLDQQATLLNQNISILDNFKNFNPDTSDTDAHLYLAQFLFRNIAALSIVKDLSGGEKLRALLACVLMAKNPPQLLILDEPTNHLDLESIVSIESALKHYQGAIIIISHDEKFIENISITKTVTAPFTKSNL